MTYSLKYPRNVVRRAIIRSLAGGALPLLARVRVLGRDKIPVSGPVILAGNHTGAMEVVMMGVHSPRMVEFMGAVEMPWNGWIGKVIDAYGLIPVHRGFTGNAAMKMGADVLRQGGALGVFPEGGFWEPGRQKAQPGVAWLSYVTQSPVLPIGFGDMRGALARMTRGERPLLEMNVGDLLPPTQLDPSIHKKDALQQAAERIMDAVWALVPEEEKKRKEARPEDETFTFTVDVFDERGTPVPIPPDLALTDGTWLSRFAHRPNLIDSIRDYIFLPVQPLKELNKTPPAREIYMAADSMLRYVERENPQYFNYRYGYEGGAAFHNSFRQLRRLMQWVIENGYQVQAEARYEFTDPRSGERRVLRVPRETEQW
jgi:1-acyl-sn-glycerol-3-phosphate acyltransferase